MLGVELCCLSANRDRSLDGGMAAFGTKQKFGFSATISAFRHIADMQFQFNPVRIRHFK